jgi:hypothetical protein
MRLALGDFEVRASHELVEGSTLAFDPIHWLATYPFRLARESGRCGRVEEKRHIRGKLRGGPVVQFADALDAEAASTALIRERGVGEAIANHVGTAPEVRAEDLLDELGAGSQVQRELSSRRKRGNTVKENVANQLTRLGTARLTCLENGATQGAQVRDDSPTLRSLAGTFATLQGDEDPCPAPHSPLPIRTKAGYDSMIARNSRRVNRF